MSHKPRLKLLRCVRGVKKVAVLKAEALLDGRRILRGPLRDCFTLASGPTVRFGRGCALMFKPVIRISA